MEHSRTEAFGSRVLRDMYDAVLVLNLQGNIVYANGPAFRMLEIKIDGDFVPGKTRFPLDADQPFNDSFNECIIDAIYHKRATQIHRVNYKAPSGREYAFRMSCSYLHDGDGELVITLSDETKAVRLRDKINQSSRIFSTFLYSFCVWIILYALWLFLGSPFPVRWLTNGVEVLGVMMFLYISRFTKMTWQELGLGVKELPRDLKRGAIIGLGSVLFLIALKGIIRLFDPNAFGPQLPFLDLGVFGTTQIIYIFTAGIQEFLARSVIQGNLRRILTGKFVAFEAIVLSSLIFAALHVHLGFFFMMGAFVLAGLEGIVYEKTGSVYTLWVIHWLFGVTGSLLHFI